MGKHRFSNVAGATAALCVEAAAGDVDELSYVSKRKAEVMPGMISSMMAGGTLDFSIRHRFTCAIE